MIKAAGLALVLPDNTALFLRRGPTQDNPGTWCFPGGNMEGDERPLDTAIRETREEVAWIQPEDDTIKPKLVPGGNGYATFKKRINSAFIPTLDAENVAYAWCKLDDPPQPVHPELAKMLPAIAMDQELSMSTSANAGVPLWKKGWQEGWTSDMTPEEWKGLVGGLLEFFAEEAQEPEHAAEDENVDNDTEVHPEHLVAIAYNGDFDMAGLLKHLRALGSMGASRDIIAMDGDDKPVKFFWDGDGADKMLAAKIDGVDVFGRIDLGATDSAQVLAMDKDSVREFDRDGRMHVSDVNICKACISPYKGSEIPRADELGLDPNKIYKLYRPAEEIEKAASTSNGIQILRKHVPVDVNDARPFDIIGSTGTDARFEYPYLKNSLHFWTKQAIDDIENNTRRELSPGYFYEPVLESGTFEGEPYDIRMSKIAFNHLITTEKGRQNDGKKSDIIVGDSIDSWATLERALLDSRAA